MATTSTTVQELYTDVVTDLKAFVDDAVLLPNSQFVLTSFNISGTAGNTVRVPITNSYTNAGTLSAGGSIKAAANSIFNPGEVDISLSKWGVGSDVQEEALEDGGFAVVRAALMDRLAGGLAQAIDINGFTVLRDAGGNSTVNQDGNVSTVGAGTITNIVMDPSALGYAVKREPSVRMWYDPDTDVHQFRASMRAGFAALWNGASTDYGVRKINDSATVGNAVVTLDEFAKAVANLRAGNYRGMPGSGMFAAFIAPSTEYSVASQLNSVTQSAIGHLSDIGNRALLTGLIGQAAGCEFYRSNNLAQGNS
jgi:hypothetical protein